ncbi:MAG: hypothetical protein DA328_07975 [Nitrososphaeraceae archaeon]|nr:hypothetical protein [Nitrososphaeraceae archaeon]
MGKLFDYIALGVVAVGGIYVYQNPKVLDEIAEKVKELFNKVGGDNNEPVSEPEPSESEDEDKDKDEDEDKDEKKKSKYSQIYDFPYISYRTILTNKGILDSNRISYF